MKNTNYLSNLIGAFSTTVSSQIEMQLATLKGKSLNHEAALVAVYNHPNDTIDVLSKILKLTHSGTVRLINALENEHLVERHKSATDARAVVLRVTELGKQRACEVLAVRQKATEQFLTNFSDQQKQALTQLLEKAMTGLTDESIQARRICRLCDESVCRKAGCPVENSLVE